MHVLVFEPRYKGHHFVYVRLIVQELLNLGCRVTLGTTVGVPETIEFAALMNTLRERIHIQMAPTDAPGKPADLYRQFREILGRTRPEHVLVPTADGLVQQCGLMRFAGRRNLLRGVEAQALLLRCTFAFPRSSLKSRLRYAAIRQCLKHSGFTGLYTIDAVAREQLFAVDTAFAARLHMMPDPLDNLIAPAQRDARRTLGIPLEGKYIGAAGVIDDRKGVDRLVRAFAHANLPPNCRLLLAGLAHPPVKEPLEREIAPLLQSGRAIWINRYLNEQDLAAVIAAVDVVCAPYINHIAPSAIIAKSAWMGRPVLASDYGWCGSMIPRFGIGWTCDTGNQAAFSRAIVHALQEERSIAPSPALQRWLEYLTPQNFAATWLSRIRERLGLPPQTLVDWDSVTRAEAGMRIVMPTSPIMGVK